MPAKKHNFTLVEIKAGILVIVSAALLVLFIAVMSGLRPAEKTLTFNAYFSDTGGLNKGADVRYGGAKVGRVVDVSLDPSNQARIRAQVSVRPDTPVNEKSEAFITQTTLTAEKHLEISTGEPDAAPLPDGSEIPTRQGSLFDQAGAVATTVQEVLEDVIDLLGIEDAHDKETKGEGEFVTVADIAETVNKTVKEGSGLVTDLRDTVEDSRDDVSAILAQAQEIGASAEKLVTDIQDILAENRPDIRGSLEGVRNIVGRVDEVSGKLEELVQSIQSVLDNAASLSGDAQGMLEANRPVIEDMLLDLRETVRNLKTFARTMAEQPDAVIRGKSAQGRK